MKPSLEEISRYLFYCDNTGKLYWKVSPSRRMTEGKEAGCTTSRGYIQLRYKGYSYPAHRIVWYIMRGEVPKIIDHINGNPSDNRIENLREVSAYQNQLNTKRFINNTSGYKNVQYSKRYRKWEVKGSYLGKRYYLGRYHNKEEAFEVYEKWAKATHGEFYRDTR